MMKTIGAFIWCLCLLMPACHPQAQRCDQKIPKSLYTFVQGFYDWYVPLINKTTSRRSTVMALKVKRTAFDSELAAALMQDEEAQEKQDKVDGSIVGIDFDPFLSSQDPCGKYVVGGITRKGEAYFAEVYSICDGARALKPDVIAELAKKGKLWVFVNFHYTNPPNTNLLDVLKRLQESRLQSIK